ncbi:uncharacterized protein LOC141857190 isoform X2 [Brevipalpus obovatus]
MGKEVSCPIQKKSMRSRIYKIDGKRSLSFMNDKDPIVRIFKVEDYDKDIKCYYQSIERDGASDDSIQLSEEREVVGHTINLEKLGLEFIKLRCNFKGQDLYQNVHFWPTRVPKQPNYSSQDEKSAQNQSVKPSVVIFVVESLSYLNFKRFLHKTEQELSKFSNDFILRGLVKMADNTFPNMIPLLVGTRPYYSKWPFGMNSENGPYDELPIIWKDFKKLNYSTGYVEDRPDFGLFNYLAKGFTSPPTDWYPRPVWLYMREEQGYQTLTDCYNHRAKFDIWLQQVKQFLNKAKKSSLPFFLWSFNIQITHEEFNGAQKIDGAIAKFLHDYRPILEDTVFIFMGDHGNRFGSYRHTSIGRIESHMPFFSIHLPKQLLSAHPHLSKYLNLNQKKLTTWLDVRQMLLDITTSNYTEILVPEKKSAYPVWRQEIPSDRTCEDALIPEAFCLCSKRTSISTESSSVLEASQAIVSKLNDMLSNKTQLCHILVLDKIKSAEIIEHSQSDQSQIMEILLSVQPSDALLQAQVRVTDQTSSKWSVNGDISRLNKYGNQSICIEDKVLRKYCFCR